MAITNQMIISNAAQQLLEAGVIQPTGRRFPAEITHEDGTTETVLLDEPEEIHTYQRWKQLGFQVRKGSTAVCKLTIWKCAGGSKSTDDEADEPTETGRPAMFRKTAHFFAQHQVDPIPA